MRNTSHLPAATWTRRGFLRVGTLGMFGLGLADYLRLSHAAEAATGKTAKAKHAIFISLGGGPSHQDTFDPKPDAPAEIRGEFGVTKTKTGVLFCEHLPKLAA